MTARRDPPAVPDKNDAPTSNSDRWDDDDGPWRHPPVAPNDESPADSLGRSISDVLIGSTDTTPPKPKPKPKP